MYNWSVDEKELKKYPQQHKIWRLEQLINYGLREEKIDKEELRENIDKINIDPAKRKYLKFLLSRE